MVNKRETKIKLSFPVCLFLFIVAYLRVVTLFVYTFFLESFFYTTCLLGKKKKNAKFMHSLQKTVLWYLIFLTFGIELKIFIASKEKNNLIDTSKSFEFWPDMEHRLNNVLFNKCNYFLGKFIQNRLLMSFFALLLIIKLIKVKFAFIIPFLFGAAVSKKIFLKLLLFLVPAFAHVFKLCSAYYSSHTKSHHHHHHQVNILL